MTRILPFCTLAGFSFVIALLFSPPNEAQQSGDITIKRLTWAGVQIVSGDTTLLIDAVGTDLWDGNAPGGLVPVEVETRRRYALITHTHNDHFDIDTLKAALGERGYVICHESQAAHIASRGLKVIPAKLWEPVSRGGFVVTALPAEDGFGDHQVSWLVTRGDTRIFHAGDTLWHGAWKLIGDQFGKIDVAFLPINGAVVQSEPPTATPAVMTPSQAVDAAVLIGAGQVVPVHFGLDDPPHYVEAENALERFLERAQESGLQTRPLAPGDTLVIGQ